MGYDGVASVRQGKVIDLDLNESDANRAEETVRSMCESLLANTVIEEYAVEIGE